MMSNTDIQSPATSFEFPDKLSQILSFFFDLFFSNTVFTETEENKDITLTCQ